MGNVRIQHIRCGNVALCFLQGDGAVGDFRRIPLPGQLHQLPQAGLLQILLRSPIGDLPAAGEIEDMDAVGAAQNGGIPRLPCFVKAPLLQLRDQAALRYIPVDAAVDGRTGIFGVLIGQIGEGFFRMSQLSLPVEQQFLRFRGAGCPGFLRAVDGAVGRHSDLGPVLSAGNHQELPEIHRLPLCRIAAVGDPEGTDCGFVAFNIIAQGSEVHITVVIHPHRIRQGIPRHAEAGFRQIRQVCIAPFLCQDIQGLRQVGQITAMHGVGLVQGIKAIEIIRGRNVCHVPLVILLAGLVGLLRGQRLLPCLQFHGVDTVPEIQSALQEILLPGIDTVVNRTFLGIQRFGKIRCRVIGPQLPLRHRQSVPDLQLFVGQLMVAQGGHHRSRRPVLPGIAALAGHIIRIAVGRDGNGNCGDRNSLRRCRFFRHPIAAAGAQQHQCRQQKQKKSFAHRKYPFLYII